VSQALRAALRREDQATPIDVLSPSRARPMSAVIAGALVLAKGLAPHGGRMRVDRVMWDDLPLARTLSMFVGFVPSFLAGSPRGAAVITVWGARCRQGCHPHRRGVDLLTLAMVVAVTLLASTSRGLRSQARTRRQWRPSLAGRRYGRGRCRLLA